MGAWQRAFDRSAAEGIAAPVAPAFIVISGDLGRCVACGEQMPAEAAQRHGYRCPVDPWTLAVR